MYTKTLIARYALYCFIAVEVLLLPKIIPLDTYASYEYIKNIIFIFPIVLLGSYSGFIYSNYTLGVKAFPALLTFGIISSFILGIFASIYLGNILYMIPFLAINLFTIVEQNLKIEKRFILAFSFKPILSVVVLALGLASYYFSFSISFQILLILGFSGSIILWLILGIDGLTMPSMILPTRKLLDQYITLIKKGFPIAMGTITLTILFFSDRYIIANYYKDYLPTYSFGFNLSQMLVMALSTIAYVSTIDIGERKDSISREFLENIFKKGLLIYFILLIAMVPALMVLEQFYPFEALVPITMIISYSKGFYFLLTIISAVVLYFDYQWHSLYAIVLITMINFALLYLVYILNFSVYVVLIVSSISLLIYSAYVLYLIFYKIRYTHSIAKV